MSGAKQANTMLIMARKDFKSLCNMMSAELHDDEVFGFHAQQAIEKSLKAWIAALGLDYKFTHDLDDLLNQLEIHGVNVDAFDRVGDLTNFAVQFRYELLPDNEDTLDREGLREQVRGLLEHVIQVHRELGIE